MSAGASPIPSDGASAPIDPATLPKGQCHYILLLPAIKGQRCACVNFSRNKGMPGATCECGHLACFHNAEAEPPNEHKQELDLLRQRIKQLEERAVTPVRDSSDIIDALLARVSAFEEAQDRLREEMAEQGKSTYRHVNGAWRSVEQSERNFVHLQAELRHTNALVASQHDEIQAIKDRQFELGDADIALEERIDQVVEALDLDVEEDFGPIPRGRRPRRRSTSDTSRPLGLMALQGRSSASRAFVQGPGVTTSWDVGADIQVPSLLSTVVPIRRAPGAVRPSQSSLSPRIWTVHISLLPTAARAMPFERNTAAYQRSLSRGLHKVVAIDGHDSASFVSAVSSAFGSLLKGRAWMPLQAKLCDAESLLGLPMLRPLEPALLHEDASWDFEFLRQQCAVCDSGGMIDSLYIAMRHDTLSWHALWQAPVWMEGLEGAWKHDPLLDSSHPLEEEHDGPDDDDGRPAAGDIVSLKRAASEMTRSNSFGSAGTPADVEMGGTGRVKRSCPAPTSIPEVHRHGVETA